MRIHAPLVALVAVFAVANVGVTTFIAAAPHPGAPQFIIASASDDPHASQPAPQPTPPQPAPSQGTPQPVPSSGSSGPAGGTPPPTAIAAGCAQALRVVMVPQQSPQGVSAPMANFPLAQFRVEFPSTPQGCVPPEPAKLRGVTLTLSWSDLDPQLQQRSVLRNIKILDAQGVTLTQPRRLDLFQHPTVFIKESAGYEKEPA